MMKYTGIIRRVDDFGRIVTPKAIRQSLGIEEGQPMELSIDTDTKTVAFTLYDPGVYKTEGDE